MQTEAGQRHRGRITVWKDGQGYGFITPSDGGTRVFVHIQSFTTRGTRPSENDIVTYRLGRNEQGQARAEQVAFAHAPAAPGRSSGAGGLGALAVAGGFLLMVAACVLAGRLPALILGAYALLSLATFIAYAGDKSAARQQRWRTPESTLHLLALAGGWPGALVAQEKLRHKSKKQPFRLVFWCTVVLNCAALLWLCSNGGAQALRTVLGAV